VNTPRNLTQKLGSWSARNRNRFAGGILVLAVAGTLAAASGCATEENLEDAANDVEAGLLQDQLDAVVEGGAPGAVLFVKDPNSDPIELSAGLSDAKAKTAMDVEDVTRIGSLTKPYVAALVLDLVEEGALALDDTVDDLVPGLLPDGDSITVRDLLGHRSGLYEYSEDPRVLRPYLDGDFAYEWAPEDLVDVAAGHGPQSEPGADVLYSNTNYTVLGLIVERVTGNDLGDELDARIFEPLGLDDTSFETDTRLPVPHANGYLIGEGKAQDVTEISPSHYWGAGNIVSDAGDVARFYTALLEGELLNQSSLAEMTSTVEETDGLDRGLGLAHGEEPCGEWYGHDGSVPGYFSVARHMEGGRQVVLLVNSVGFDDTVGAPEAQAAVADLMKSALCR